MPTTSNRVPSYRCHKPSGQAVVTLDGRDYYLGPHGTKASKREYDRIVGEWQANGRRVHDHDSITVTELAAAYWKFAKDYYRKDGRVTQDWHIKTTLQYLKRLYGHARAKDFGPLAFKAVRFAMISDGRFCRRYINALGGWIKHIFKWATENELVPPSVYHGLQAVSGLSERVAQVFPIDCEATRRAYEELDRLDGLHDWVFEVVMSILARSRRKKKPRNWFNWTVWDEIRKRRMTGVAAASATQ